MPALLPPNPSLDQLKNRAKELRRAYASGDSDAVELVTALHPACSDGAGPLDDLTLRDAQLVVARDHYFENWTRLKEYCEWDIAVIDQDLSRIETLLNERPDRSRQDIMRFRRDGTHWLLPPVALANNNVPMLEGLMASGATLETPSQAVLQPTSSRDYIDFALDHGADLERNYYNGTVLSIAAYSGAAEPVAHYIRRGADVNVKCDVEDNRTWETPLHRACFCDPRQRGHNYDSWDSDRDYEAVVRSLIEGGADVNARANVGERSDMGPGVIAQAQTPLHFAAGAGAETLVEMLIVAGADVNAETAEGEKAVDYARRYEREGVIRKLGKGTMHLTNPRDLE